jgi:hypothetical protein
MDFCLSPHPGTMSLIFFMQLKIPWPTTIVICMVLHSWWPFGHNDDHLMDFQLGCCVLKLPEQHMLQLCNAKVYLSIIEFGKWRALNWQTSSNSVNFHAPDFIGLTFILAALMFLLIQMLDRSTFLDSVIIQRQRLWDPGEFLHKFQVTPYQLWRIVVFKLQGRSNGATFQHVFCWCFPICVQLANSQSNTMY